MDQCFHAMQLDTPGAPLRRVERAGAEGRTRHLRGIHMSDIPGFPYTDLWEERSIRSVVNLTRADGAAFLEAPARCDLRTHVTALPLTDANGALVLISEGAARGNP